MPETVKCPNCGENVPKNNRFCDNCGYKMVTAREEQKKPELKKETEKKEEIKKEEFKKTATAPLAATAKTEKKAIRATDLVETVETGYFDADITPGDEGFLKVKILNWELIAYAAIIIITILTRFADLGTKPLHHDESMHAFYGWKLFRGDGYQYNPMMHGPFHYHAGALMYLLFGASNYTARLAPAIYGLIGVALVYFYRPYLGRLGAIFTALIMALSPSFMYQARFIREDIFMAVDNILLVIGLMKFIDTKKPLWLFLASIGLALAWATKEATYITVAIFGSFFFFRWLWEYSIRTTERFSQENKIISSLDYLLKKDVKTLIYTLLIFFGINLFLYTTMFTYPMGIIDAFTKSLTYWMGQHEVHRGSQPGDFYFLLMPFYEQIPVLFGIIASVYFLVKKEKRTFFNIFMIWWGYMALGAYTVAGEKMPWLVLHILTPFLILSGKMAGEIFLKKDWGYWRTAGIAVFVVLLGFSLHSSINLCFYKAGANPAESLIYVQSSTDVTKVVKMIKNLSDDVNSHPELNMTGGEDLDMCVEDYCSWPFAWYLRDFKKIDYPHPVGTSDKGKALILSGIEAAAAGHDEQVAALLKDQYAAYKYKLREWWAPDRDMFAKMELKDQLLWLWKRLMYKEVWSPLGSYDFVVYVRKDLEKYWK